MPDQEARRNSLELLLPGGLESKSTEKIQEIPLRLIQPNPFQARTQFPEETIKELAESIKSNGVLQPIIVRSLHTESESYQLVAGERRLRACKFLNRETIPAIVRDYQDPDMRILALLENLQREDLPVLDKALGIKSLLFELKTIGSVTKALGISERSAQYYLRIAEMPEPFQRLIAEKNVDYKTSISLASLLSKTKESPSESQEKMRARILASLENESLTPDTFKRMESRLSPAAKIGGASSAPRDTHGGFTQTKDKLILRLEIKKNRPLMKGESYFINIEIKRFFNAIKKLKQ